MTPRPRMGDRISYFIVPKEKGQTTNWQRARALEDYDAETLPYDPSFYLKKMEDWVTKYKPFLDMEKLTEGDIQGDLF